MFWYCVVVVSYSLTKRRFCSLIIHLAVSCRALKEPTHFMMSLMYSRRMLSDSVSMFVYAMKGPKLTAC